ncbi:MAG: HAD family phosphatase [Lentisphaeria bacterium]|nr:HAD family phosphatase [Lentisphaeria bacterium]
MAFRAMVVTDLDGTLLDGRRCISAENLGALSRLGAAGVLRVAATGRSLHSVRQVLGEGVPFDSVVFSSGAGIVDWGAGELVSAAHLSPEEVSRAIGVLRALGVNFAVHDPVPGNHCFAFEERQLEATDFRRRCEAAGSFSRPLGRGEHFPSGASQLLAVIPEDLERLACLCRRLEGFSVIRTTSPVDHRSIWVEVFPAGVNKAGAAQWLADRYGIPASGTYAIGNDYNDTHLLDWASHAAVTANAPAELRQCYPVVASNEDHAFSRAVAHWGLLPTG